MLIYMKGLQVLAEQRDKAFHADTFQLAFDYLTLLHSFLFTLITKCHCDQKHR